MTGELLGLSANFALYWDGDLHHELLDDKYITKYNEATKQTDVVIEFTGCVSNNGTKRPLQPFRPIYWVTGAKKWLCHLKTVQNFGYTAQQSRLITGYIL